MVILQVNFLVFLSCKHGKFVFAMKILNKIENIINDIYALNHSWIYVIQLNYVCYNGPGRTICRPNIKIHLRGQDYITMILFG